MAKQSKMSKINQIKSKINQIVRHDSASIVVLIAFGIIVGSIGTLLFTSSPSVTGSAINVNTDDPNSLANTGDDNSVITGNNDRILTEFDLLLLAEKRESCYNSCFNVKEACKSSCIIGPGVNQNCGPVCDTPYNRCNDNCTDSYYDLIDKL